jgi:hypothetical protein
VDYERITPVTDRGGGLAEDFVTYWKRARPLLPNFPEDVASQWFHEDPTQVEEWAWLDYCSLRFARAVLPTSELPLFNEGSDGTVDTFEENWERSDQAIRLTRYFREFGTWPRPPILLANPRGEIHIPWRRDSFPFQLLEGHHRFAVMRRLMNEPFLATSHAVWIASKVTR